MKNDLIEVGYRQIGSTSRVRIVINQSTVTISGHGRLKQEKFCREEKTSAALWDQLVQRVSKFSRGDLPALAKLDSKAPGTHAVVSIQTGEYTETSNIFAELDQPDLLKPLLGTIFSAQSLLEEVAYFENGMSENLKIRIRRERTEVDENGASADRKRQSVFITPSDYWELLIAALNDFEFSKLPDLEAPSDRRAADMSLYATLAIEIGGRSYTTKSFDDDNPPKPLQEFIKLIKSSKTDAFRMGHSLPNRC